MPKDKLGDWLEAYVKLMEISYWPKTRASKALWDEASEEWCLDVVRDGEPITLRPKQLVFALGVSGYPIIPELPGAASFLGEQQHSSAHRDSSACAGKRCVVLGGNNSAHDICASLWEHGAEVTMVQRSSTLIVRSETLVQLGIGPLYSEEALDKGIDVETADLILASTPYRLVPEQQRPLYEQIRARDEALYARLAQAGFLLDFGDDGTGLWTKYLRRGSGAPADCGVPACPHSGRWRAHTVALAHSRRNPPSHRARARHRVLHRCRRERAGRKRLDPAARGPKHYRGARALCRAE
jgi:putative flavoprotein involved in K+ transport